MEPRNRKESFELIRELFGPAETITIAAPFFGDGALVQLGLEKSAAKLTVICDLFSGGCNPQEIKKFLNPEIDLRTHDRLHAKIYLTDKDVVIGSANPSANGLGFEGDELDGQIEACVYSEDPNIVRAWKQFVKDEIYPKSRKIEKPDIQKAKWLWELKRNARTRVNLGTLLETMKSDQEYFKDKRISFIPHVEGTKFPRNEIREFIRMIKQANDFSRKSYPEWEKSGYEMAQEVRRLLQD